MKLALLILASTIIFLSFSKKEKEDPFYYKNIEKGMCLIPGGIFRDYSEMKRCFTSHCPVPIITVDSFYLSNHEVTNLEYRNFVEAIAKDSGELYKKYLPDTLTWRDEQAYNEEYVEWYYRHPAYNNYPVVGVTYEQAEIFCHWLTKKYMNAEKRKFKNVVFKPPTKNQWTYAALGGDDGKIVPFKNGKLINKKGKYQAVFKIIEQEFIKKDSVTSTFRLPQPHGCLDGKMCYDSYDITSPVLSCFPNQFKLYHLAGNVEEYVAEKGITKGGGWKDTGYFLQNFVCQTYDSTNVTSDDRGFRVAMEIVK